MSEPVMTDEAIRETLTKELRHRVTDFGIGAKRERQIANMCGPEEDERGRAAFHLRYAAHYDRCSAHYQQAIDALSKLPMPERSES